MPKPIKKPAPPVKKEDVVEVFGCEQRSDEWMNLRLGLPTASRFSVIMASGKDGGDSVGRAKLMNQLAGEILTGEVAETFRSEAMERGNRMEPEARDYYARTRFVDLDQVGFVKRTIHNPLGSALVVGASPDSLVGESKVLEIKTMRPDLLIEVSLRGAAGFPTSHRAQCQGTLWVTGRDECDLLLFYTGMPVAPIFTIERDDVYIRQITEAVEVFAYELKQLVEKIKNMGSGR